MFLFPLAAPEPVENCTVSEVGRTSARLSCEPGFDGGLAQTFTLSVIQGGGQNEDISESPTSDLTGIRGPTEDTRRFKGSLNEPKTLKETLSVSPRDPNRSKEVIDRNSNPKNQKFSGSNKQEVNHNSRESGFRNRKNGSKNQDSESIEQYFGSKGRNPRAKVLANTSSSPKSEFVLSGLAPGREYLLEVISVNSRGSSDPVTLLLHTVQDMAQQRTSPGGGFWKSRLFKQIFDF